jgi:hypothetical protein
VSPGPPLSTMSLNPQPLAPFSSGVRGFVCWIWFDNIVHQDTVYTILLYPQDPPYIPYTAQTDEISSPNRVNPEIDRPPHIKSCSSDQLFSTVVRRPTRYGYVDSGAVEAWWRNRSLVEEPIVFQSNLNFPPPRTMMPLKL